MQIFRKYSIHNILRYGERRGEGRGLGSKIVNISIDFNTTYMVFKYSFEYHILCKRLYNI